MGVSYDFTVGYGFEVSEKRLRKIDPGLYDEYGTDEFLADLLVKEYPLLSYAWAGNAYLGDGDSGYIVVVKSQSHTQYGWRVEKTKIDGLHTPEEEVQLLAAFERFGKRNSGIGFFAASSVG